MLETDDDARDSASFVLLETGALIETTDPPRPWVLLDPESAIVAPVETFFAEPAAVPALPVRMGRRVGSGEPPRCAGLRPADADRAEGLPGALAPPGLRSGAFEAGDTARDRRVEPGHGAVRAGPAVLGVDGGRRRARTPRHAGTAIASRRSPSGTSRVERAAWKAVSQRDAVDR